METDEVIIAQSVDESFDRKIHADTSTVLSPSEKSKLRNTLERMKKSNDEPKEIRYSPKNHMLYAYLYCGEGDGTALD